MKVYIVLEDDRGAGPSVQGVYLFKSNVPPLGSHEWLCEEEILDVPEVVETQVKIKKEA